MAVRTKGAGPGVKSTAGANTVGLMGHRTLVNGGTVLYTAMALFHPPMGPVTKETGRVTLNMV